MFHFLSDVFSHPDLQGSFIIAGKAALIYIFLVIGLRLLGRRELGQMTVYDLVLLIILANSVQNAMVGNDTTLVGGLVAGITLLTLNKLFNKLIRRSKRIERIMVGEPLLIINDGKLIKKHMESEGITREQVMAALREHGIENLDDVHLGVLEVDGTISIVPNQSTVYRGRRHYRALRLG